MKKMKRAGRSHYQTELNEIFTYKGKTYYRDEVIIVSDFSEANGLHTIAWNDLPEEKRIDGPLEFYSGDMGWAENNILHKDAPVPELELEYLKQFIHN